MGWLRGLFDTLRERGAVGNRLLDPGLHGLPRHNRDGCLVISRDTSRGNLSGLAFASGSQRLDADSLAKGHNHETKN